MLSLITVICTTIITTKVIADAKQLTWTSKQVMTDLDVTKQIKLDIVRNNAIAAAGVKLYRGSLNKNLTASSDATADVVEVMASAANMDVQYFLSGGMIYQTAAGVSPPSQVTIEGLTVLTGPITAISMVNNTGVKLVAASGVVVVISPNIVRNLSSTFSVIESLLGIGNELFVAGGSTTGAKKCVKMSADYKTVTEYNVKHSMLMTYGTMVYLIGGKGGSPGLTMLDGSKQGTEAVMALTTAPFNLPFIDGAVVEDTDKKQMLFVLREDMKLFGSYMPTDASSYSEYPLPEMMNGTMYIALAGSPESGGLTAITLTGTPPKYTMFNAAVPPSRPSAAANLKVSVAALGVALFSVTALLA